MAKVISNKKLKYYWVMYFLVLPSLALILLFSYYPVLSGIYHSFFRWNGADVTEYIGFKNFEKIFNDTGLLNSFGIVFIFVLSNFVKMIPSIITAVVIHRLVSEKSQYFYRVLFVIPMIVPSIVGILIWKYFYDPNVGILNAILNFFSAGGIKPIAFLGDRNWVIPSIIFMGFPWVGAVGVLIYLAGLQSIDDSVYESASIDGATSLQLFFKIELPLIMTQIRINLVLMIIGTIQGWEFIYVMLGEEAGPGGIATVPGLYIFKQAFKFGYFGYGCAIGMILFFIILGLTWINNKFVKVDR
jgi:raffinose/stachyose/melibiose transport system permease protein